MLNQTVTRAHCPECGCIDVVMDMVMGESVCRGCGLVIQENILDPGAEWRAFTPGEKKSRPRVGSPTKYSHFDKGLSTVIRVGNDAFGHPLSSNAKRQMWRLVKWQLRSRVHVPQYRNLIMAMDELDRLSEKLHIPLSLQEMAALIYRKTLDKDLVRGRSIAAVVAGALYAACRFTKTPRTLNEITDVSLRNQKEISTAYRLIVRNLGIKMPIDDPLDYVTKISEKAGVSSDVEGLAIKIIKEAKNKRAAMGKDPSGLAAAALYIASKKRKERMTLKHLARAAGVTAVTVRNRKSDLMKCLNLNFD